MKTYVVGGAVRDELLGLPVKDRDWVVVGASPQIMIDLGYKPVGKDFPVFLHPKTHEEYALARTERKVGKGYTGFTFHAAPDVTLEQDLARRDLTINAIARSESGELIDPFHGRDDLRAGLLRHVGMAFVEDPVRILRVARFAARFDFKVAEETLDLMRRMVADGEVDALVPERVWQEFAKGLMEGHPSRLFRVLRACGALAKLLPEIDRLFGESSVDSQGRTVDRGEYLMRVIDCTAEQGCSLAVRWAALLHDVGRYKATDACDRPPAAQGDLGAQAVLAICARLRVPADCRDLARLAAELHEQAHQILRRSSARALKLLQRCDAFRRPERFNEFLQVCAAAACGGSNGERRDDAPVAYLHAALATASAVNSGRIAAQAGDKTRIPLLIARERLARLRELKKQWNAV